MFFSDVFFFKQKTAYEMRISDWSSDVCSSDLARQLVRDLFDLIAAKLRLDAVVNYDLVENSGDHCSWLHLVAYCGISDEMARKYERLVLEETICCNIVRAAQMVHITTIQRSDDRLTAILREAGFNAFAGIPLKVRDRTIGLLGFGRRWTGHFGKGELDFLQTVSTYVASAEDHVHADAALRASEDRKSTRLNSSH